MILKKSGKRVVAKLFLIVVYLAALDVAIGIIFRYPSDPVKTRPSEFQQYFEYGRSTEGKFSRMTVEMRDWGWLTGPPGVLQRDASGKPGKPVIALYGMSHTGDLASAVSKLTAVYAVRAKTAPGGTPNWAYAAYQTDEERPRVAVAVLGIMTLGVPFITTTTGATMNFDASYLYTYPRYFLRDGSLIASWPPFTSLEGFFTYFHNADKWRQYRKWLSANDGYYDPLLFKKSFLDESSLGRSLRRLYAVRSRERKESLVYGPQGFRRGTEVVAVLRAIVRDFARSAREQGSLPIIYVINNQGCGKDLLMILLPTLEADHIPYLSTDKICPPDDPSAFKPGRDGHFTEEKNLELARALLDIIRDQRLPIPGAVAAATSQASRQPQATSVIAENARGSGSQGVHAQ
jgi:hypothetical protein